LSHYTVLCVRINYGYKTKGVLFNGFNLVRALKNCFVQFLLIDPAAITSSSSNTVAVEGSSISLYCNTAGNPPPKITWIKDGNNTVLNTGESFTLNNITRQQAGDYTCKVVNGIGSEDNATVTVTVHCKL